MTRRILPLVVLVLLGAASAAAQRNWNAPFPAHHVSDNIYFVGTEQLGTFLVTTPTVLRPCVRDFGTVALGQAFE